MQRIVRLIVERRPHLSTIPIALSFLFGLFFRPFMLMTTVTVAFVALCCGRTMTVKAIVGSLVLVSFFSLIFSLGLPYLILALSLWLPMSVSAIVHRNYGNFCFSLLAIAVFVFLYLCLFRVSVESVDSFWLGKVSNFLSKLPVNELNLTESEIALISSQVHLWSIVLFKLFLVGSLLVSRWYQSKMYNPGGFSKEFLSITFPKFFAIVLLLCLLINVSEIMPAEQSGIFGDVSILIMLLYFFQGLSVIHFRGREKNLAAGWFTALYFLILLLPQFVGLIIIVTGAMGSFVNLKNREKN